MTSTMNPYISFPGTAREAMDFYRNVFGGELTLSTFGEYGDQDAPGADQIMHAQLETPAGFTLMGSDPPPGTNYTPGARVSVSLSGDDTGELHGYWDRLSADGTVQVPLEKQMWGDEFGQCEDRFGVAWLVNIAQPTG